MTHAARKNNASATASKAARTTRKKKALTPVINPIPIDQLKEISDQMDHHQKQLKSIIRASSKTMKQITLMKSKLDITKIAKMPTIDFMDIDHMRNIDQWLQNLNNQPDFLLKENTQGQFPLHLAIDNQLPQLMWMMMLIDRNKNNCSSIISSTKKQKPVIEQALDPSVTSEHAQQLVLTFLMHSPQVWEQYFLAYQQTLLHYAVSVENIIAIKQMLAFNYVDYNITDKDKNTALHLAAKRQSPVIIECLLQYPINRLAINKDKQMAFQMINNNESLAKHLMPHNALEPAEQTHMLEVISGEAMSIIPGMTEGMAHRQLEQNELYKLIYWRLISNDDANDTSLDKIDFDCFYELWKKIKSDASKDEASLQYKQFLGQTQQIPQSWQTAQLLGMHNFLFQMQTLSMNSSSFHTVREESYWKVSQQLYLEMQDWVHSNQHGDQLKLTLQQNRRLSDQQFPSKSSYWLAAAFYSTFPSNTRMHVTLGLRQGKLDWDSCKHLLICLILWMLPAPRLYSNLEAKHTLVRNIEDPFVKSLCKIAETQYQIRKKSNLLNVEMSFVKIIPSIIHDVCKILTPRDKRSYLIYHASKGAISGFLCHYASTEDIEILEKILKDVILQSDTEKNTNITRNMAITIIQLIQDDQNDSKKGLEKFLKGTVHNLINQPHLKDLMFEQAHVYLIYLFTRNIITEKDVGHIKQSFQDCLGKFAHIHY